MEPVFISYVHENKELIDRLYQELTSRGIEVWRDVQNLKPGGFWKEDIRKAIQDGAFFVACFSKEYNEHDETYMNEELTIAIEKLRQRHPNRKWFIPIKLNECELPDFDIGRGKTIEDLTYVKLYEDWDAGIQSILEVIQPESSAPATDENTAEEGIGQNGISESFESFTDDEFKFEPSSEEYRSMIIGKIEDTLQDVENNLKNHISDKEAFKLIGKHDALERLTVQINSIREDSVNLVDPTSATIGIPQYLNTSNKFLNAAYFTAKNIRDNPRGLDGSVASSPEGEIGKKEAMSQIMDYINYIK